MEQDNLHWHAPEYEEKNNSADWYWAVGIIAISGAAVAILFKNILFGVFILLSAIILMMFASRKPRIISAEVNRKGVRVEQYLYPYETLESFWVENDDHHRLFLKSKKVFMPYIIIPVQDINLEQLRSYLLAHLHEDYHSEPITQKLLDHLGF